MWYGCTSAEKDCISVSLLAYVYLDHGSSSNCGHGCISIVLSSLRIHMFGCAHVLQNILISFLIRHYGTKVNLRYSYNGYKGNRQH